MTEANVTGTRSLASFLGDDAAAAPFATADDAATGTGLGEVIESSTTRLVAQARRLHGAPDFGAFVRVESEEGRPIVGVVHEARTQSVEPNRRPTAYGKTEAELRREQPQIFELLRTQFEVFVLGTFDGEAFVHLFPPQPARIHSFVQACDDAQVRAVTEDPQYLRSLLQASGLPTDELLLASLRQALLARGAAAGGAASARPRGGGDEAAAYLARMGSELSRLLRDDYDRLTSLIRRLAAWR
jgi:hypothetical protein